MSLLKLSPVLLVSPIDITGRILGPLRHEREFAEILSRYRTTYLIVGISVNSFLKRSTFVRQVLGPVPSSLRVIAIPFLDKRYLVVASKLVFSAISTFVLMLLYKPCRIKTVIVRDNAVPAVMSLFARVLGVSIIYRAINTPFSAEETSVFDFPSPIRKLHKLLIRTFDLVALRTADAIFVPSPDSKGLVLSRYLIGKKKIECVRFPIPDYFYDLKAPRTSEDDVKNIVLTYCGSFYEFYDFSMLLSAIDQLKTDGLRVILNMYGDGPLRKRVREQSVMLGIENEVVIHNPVPREEIPKVYRTATAAVIPYSNQFERGICLKSIEAMALGIPLILSKQSDHVFENERNCIIVGENSTEGWAGAIRMLLDLELRRKIVQEGFETSKPYKRTIVAELLRAIIPP